MDRTICCIHMRKNWSLHLKKKKKKIVWWSCLSFDLVSLLDMVLLIVIFQYSSVKVTSFAYGATYFLK